MATMDFTHYPKNSLHIAPFLLCVYQRLYWAQALRFSQWRGKRKWVWKVDRRGAEDDHIR